MFEVLQGEIKTSYFFQLNLFYLNWSLITQSLAYSPIGILYSANFFPKYIAVLFMTLHIYVYSTPYGFARIALVPYCLLVTHAMIFTLLSIEVPAVLRGAVSNECPREVYVKLGWSDWTANLPPEWSIFQPLNARYIPLYDRYQDDDDDDDNVVV